MKYLNHLSVKFTAITSLFFLLGACFMENESVTSDQGESNVELYQALKDSLTQDSIFRALLLEAVLAQGFDSNSVDQYLLDDRALDSTYIFDVLYDILLQGPNSSTTLSSTGISSLGTVTKSSTAISSSDISSSQRASSSSYNGTRLVIDWINPSFEDSLPIVKFCPDDPEAMWYCPDEWEYNPRLAGDPGIFGVTNLYGFTTCSGTTDLLPNAPTLSPVAPASDGGFYIGMVCDDGNNPTSETIAQQLQTPLVAEQSYQSYVDLATATDEYWNGTLAGAGRFIIIGRMAASACVGSAPDQQILYDSGSVTNAGWETFDIKFTPTKAWTHLFITMSDNPSACYINSSNILIDNLQPMVPVP